MIDQRARNPQIQPQNIIDLHLDSQLTCFSSTTYICLTISYNIISLYCVKTWSEYSSKASPSLIHNQKPLQKLNRHTGAYAVHISTRPKLYINIAAMGPDKQQACLEEIGEVSPLVHSYSPLPFSPPLAFHANYKV